MTDYSKLSDFEINNLIAESLFKNASSINKVKPVYPVGVSGNKVFESAYRELNPDRFNKNAVEVCFVDLCYIKDYCNNPSDAWPIILGNKISLLEDGGEWEASIDYPCDIGAYGTTEICSKIYEDRNPLRCAMIVFLMFRGLNETK